MIGWYCWCGECGRSVICVLVIIYDGKSYVIYVKCEENEKIVLLKICINSVMFFFLFSIIFKGFIIVLKCYRFYSIR